MEVKVQGQGFIFMVFGAITSSQGKGLERAGDNEIHTIVSIYTVARQFMNMVQSC